MPPGQTHALPVGCKCQPMPAKGKPKILQCCRPSEALILSTHGTAQIRQTCTAEFQASEHFGHILPLKCSLDPVCMLTAPQGGAEHCFSDPRHSATTHLQALLMLGLQLVQLVKIARPKGLKVHNDRHDA